MIYRIDEFIERGLNGKAPTTKKTYRHALEQFSRWLEGVGTNLVGYARSDVQQYIDYLVSRKKGAATINKIFNVIKKYSTWAGKREAAEDINVIKTPDLKLVAPKALEKKERASLIREVDRKGNRRNYAVVIVLLNTGVRLSELVGLDRDDIKISPRKGEMWVRKGKGNKERKIPLNVETRRALMKYLEERDDSEEALFISNRGKRISQRMVQYVVNKYGCSVHQLRHTFITELVRSKEDIATIRALSGHQSADMVLRYSQPTEEDLQNAVESIYGE